MKVLLNELNDEVAGASVEMDVETMPLDRLDQFSLVIGTTLSWVVVIRET